MSLGVRQKRSLRQNECIQCDKTVIAANWLKRNYESLKKNMEKCAKKIAKCSETRFFIQKTFSNAENLCFSMKFFLNKKFDLKIVDSVNEHQHI